MKRLVGTLGFSEHQYIAVRHSDNDQEHTHVAINKIHPETLRAIEMRRWDDIHRICGRFGAVLRVHGNELAFEDVKRGIRVKASSVGHSRRRFVSSGECSPPYPCPGATDSASASN